MAASTTSSLATLTKRIKAESFDQEKLPSYALCLQLGTRDFSVCVINKQTSTCIFLEEYRLEGIKTVNLRLEAVRSIIERHPILSGKFWDSIKLSYKTHKFTLIPSNFFLPEASSDYLALNCDIKTKIEEVYYYKHITSSAVNVFAADRKINAWVRKYYAPKSVQVIHQGSAFMEGILRYDDHSHEPTVFVLIEKHLLHLAVTHRQTLLFYNQFVAKTSEEQLKYLMLTLKSHGISQKTGKVIVWGALKNNAPAMDVFKKYIRNVSFGDQPVYVKPAPAFAEVEPHRYFDLYSIFLCE